MRKAGTPSLLHGVIVAGFSILIIEIALLYWTLLPGAVTGFLLTGPFLATGLYVLSQKLEAGRGTWEFRTGADEGAGADRTG